MKKAYGFTIVELLIVIVVIGILAAISIVAYNGIQDKAQRSVAQAEVRNIEGKVKELFATSGAYPASITDCPNPAAGSLCLPNSGDKEVRYEAATAGGSSHSVRLQPTYDLAVMTPKQFLYTGVGERTGAREFAHYTDFAPYIDKYGLRPYLLSFDIKTTSTASGQTMRVYFQNGSNTRYNMGATVPVTTEYTRQTVTFTPTVNNLSVSQAMLAFYGVYDSGNRPIIKDVRLELAP